MSKSLHFLIDKRIERLEKIHDYIQLFFFDGAILNIFNVYAIIGALDPHLAGYKIAAVKDGMEIIILFLLPEGSIQIGLKDVDYRGPEAIQYIREDGQCVVWP